MGRRPLDLGLVHPIGSPERIDAKANRQRTGRVPIYATPFF
jgi:hypothetical protein